jgi:biotin operon repressor
MQTTQFWRTANIGLKDIPALIKQYQHYEIHGWPQLKLAHRESSTAKRREMKESAKLKLLNKLTTTPESIPGIAERVGMSRDTIYNYLKELMESGNLAKIKKDGLIHYFRV